jgi:hypothetical protein
VGRNLLCVVSVCSLLLTIVVVAGCGDSETESSSEAQLEKAKEEGERVAEERARVDDLEKEVRSLKRSARRSKAGTAHTTPTVASENGSENEFLRTFHAPSGNVSCAITSTGAFCTVDSIATTFRLQDGEAGEIEAGSVLPRASGELAGYGSVVSAGSVTCTVPEADEPRGIACVDGGSGHGFEASRVASRQDVY